MGRGQQQQANKIFGESQDVYNNATGKSNQLYDTLLPQYEAEATNPQGFGTALPGMRTNLEQVAGGSESGAVGSGLLQAARSRNRGGFESALDDSARKAGETLSNSELNLDTENQLLKEQQKQEGLSGEAGLYGTSNADMLSALGLGTGAVNAGTEAGKSGWFQNMLGLMNTMGNLYKAFKPGSSGSSGDSGNGG